MRELSLFPTNIVSKTSSYYNKAFHAKLFTLFASSESEVYDFAKCFSPHYNFCYGFMKNDEGQWFLDADGIDRVRRWILAGAKRSMRHVGKLYDKWQKDWARYLNLSARLSRLNLKKLSDKGLFQEFQNFYRFYLRVGSVAYIADSFMSTGEKDWLEEMMKKELRRLKIKNNLAEMVRILTSPVHLSFTLEEEFELLKIAKALSAKFKKIPLSIRILAKKCPGLFKSLVRHRERFFWIHNNYYNVKFLGVNEFYKKIKNIFEESASRKTSVSKIFAEKKEEFELFRQRRAKALSEFKLSAYHKNVLEIAKLFSKWKDARKSGVYIGMFHFDRFLEEIGRRKGISKKNMNFLVFDEIEKLFLYGQNKREDIEQRKRQTFFAVTPKGFFICGGNNANKYFKYFKRGQSTVEIESLRGVSASPGIASGVVRIIRKTEEMRQFKNGEILVTNQTTPEFVPIMKKAAAIVTEQGGITSHAAVVSREMGKPCVIGTKIATEVFRDGDTVEVDATQGIVRKIK